MSRDVRWVLILLLNLLLMLLAAEANHYLAALSFHVFIGGLLLVFPILRLELRQGLACTAGTAFFLEVGSSLAPGTLVLVMMACHLVLFSIRGRFARETRRAGVVCALFLNLVLGGVLTAATLSGTLDQPVFWQRAIVETVVSAAAVALAAPWFLALQKNALLYTGIDLEAEQRLAR